MKRQLNIDATGLCPLSDDEMKNISGGFLQSLVRFAVRGASYFFNMGLHEGRRMRDLL